VTYQSGFDTTRLDFYLTQGANVVYTFPNFYGNQPGSQWSFDPNGDMAVAFRDVNGDGTKDVVVAAMYDTKGNAFGTIRWYVGGVYINQGESFSHDTELHRAMNDNLEEKTIESIQAYASAVLSGKKPEIKHAVAVVPEFGLSLVQFTPKKWHILARAGGDLNRDDSTDSAMVIQSGISRTPNDAPGRALIIVFKLADGRFQRTAVSMDAILKGDEGGAFGDPFDVNGLSIKDNQLSFGFYGGSAERWTVGYTFSYIDFRYNKLPAPGFYMEIYNESGINIKGEVTVSEKYDFGEDRLLTYTASGPNLTWNIKNFRNIPRGLEVSLDEIHSEKLRAWMFLKPGADTTEYLKEILGSEPMGYRVSSEKNDDAIATANVEQDSLVIRLVSGGKISRQCPERFSYKEGEGVVIMDVTAKYITFTIGGEDYFWEFETNTVLPTRGRG